MFILEGVEMCNAIPTNGLCFCIHLFFPLPFCCVLCKGFVVLFTYICHQS